MKPVDAAIASAKRRGLSVEAFCHEIAMPFLPGAGWIFARAQFAGSKIAASDACRPLRENERRMRCGCGKVRVYPLSTVAKLSRPYRCASCTQQAKRSEHSA